MATDHKTLADLFPAHVAELQRRTEAALAATGFDGLVVHSGTPMGYFADDQDAPFRSTPHFAHWTPLAGPGHLLIVRGGENPRLVRLAPADYWYEQAPLGNPFWAGAFDLVECGSFEEVLAEVPAGRLALVSDVPDDERWGERFAAANPEDLVARLDWNRSLKTPYEIACLDVASERGARAHQAARETFLAGASELQIHQAYMASLGVVEAELPYNNIIALNEKGAVLHYEAKRRTPTSGEVLLIDCGARCHGYASDITRTWTRTGCDPVFVELRNGMDRLQQELVAGVKPGMPYPDIHHHAHVAIGDLLQQVGILKVGGEDAVGQGLTRPFFPHGVGHFLGLQVHDVGGHQANPEGGANPPPEKHPYLRTTRTIEAGQVFTVEPGLYFIDMLLQPQREGEHRDQFDWPLIERLTPFGGIRIEDNVVVTEDGHRNLTRAYLS